MILHPTRESWLVASTDLVRPWFAEAGQLFPKVRLACGWPSAKGTSANQRRIGECWSSRASADGTHEIFISPWLEAPVDVLATVVHELVHSAVGTEHGHKSPFRRLAVALGLTGKMTATVPGPALAERLYVVSEALGPYPHAKLDASSRKKQTTRLLKIQCPACGYPARVTRKWLDEAGALTCACGERMVEA